MRCWGGPNSGPPPLELPWKLVPSGSTGRQAYTVGCAVWASVFKIIRPRDVLCHVMELIAPTHAESWGEEPEAISMWCLQQLPNLQCLRVIKSPPEHKPRVKYPPVVVSGGAPEINWMRHHLKCESEEGIDVRLKCTAGTRSCIVSIQKNGHPVLCACDNCCS